MIYCWRNISISLRLSTAKHFCGLGVSFSKSFQKNFTFFHEMKTLKFHTFGVNNKKVACGDNETLTADDLM